MKRYLFLDDERFPEDIRWVTIADPSAYNAQWEIVRSFEQAACWVSDNGFPDVVSFDHDLGTGPSGYDFALWLIDLDLDCGLMPVDFQYTVHSMNPVGAEKIRCLMDQYINKVHRIKGTKSNTR